MVEHELSERTMDLRFLEIEHKFVVAADYDPQPLFDTLSQLPYQKHYQTQVQDTYFLVASNQAIVYRHRLDSSLQQLTLKSVAGDNETRTEINLDLGLEKGDQSEAIKAFLSPQGIAWSGTLSKALEVFYFSDVEICFYKANYLGRVVSCIEIEARSPASLEAAQTSLKVWEERLGLPASSRSQASLLELLILPNLPAELQLRLQKVTSRS